MLKKGFSLIEVLVFTSILSLIFIAAVAVGTVSIRNSKNSENKILATRYAEALMDWFHGQQQADWEAFKSHITPPPIAVYCFSEEPIESWPTSVGECTDQQKINSLFTREAALTDLVDSVEVDINVSWNEGGNSYNVPISGLLAPLE